MKIGIIGSGISGMMTAWMLREKAVEIVLFDRQQPGQESSWAGGGILSPLYPWRYADSVTRLASASQAVYADIVKEIQEESGIDSEYMPSGMLVFSPGEEEIARGWAERWSIRLETVDTEEVAELEPALAAPEESAIWFPGAAQVRNPKLMKALYAGLSKRPNVRFMVDEEVMQIEPGSSGEIRLETKKTTESFDKVVLCAGAWSPMLVEHFGIKPDIRPLRGQMLLFHTEPDSVRRIALHENHYAIPRKDGRVLFGSTIEDVGYVKETTREARHQLFALALQLYPSLSEAPVEHHWAGLRPASPEGIPYIAACPSIENLYINAGHFRNGVVLAPASAQLVADLVTGEQPAIDPAPYGLDAERKKAHDTAPEQPE
ncbi:MAG: glycine oxidase ThiO [Gammaproteobacteria bacterium]|jgi:glycine oxidase